MDVDSQVVEGTDIPGNSNQRPARESWPGALVAGLAFGVIFASASLVVASLAVRLMFGPEPDLRSLALITIGTLAGTLAGGRWVQPRISRLLTAVRAAARDTSNQADRRYSG